MRIILLALCAALGVLPLTSVAARADALPQPSQIRTDTPSGLPVPRFVSLKAHETYGRAGPSFRHPINWELRRRGLPVEVIAETEHWRKVRDHQGDEMWIHYSRLDGRRHALVAGCDTSGCAVRAAPRPQSRLEAVVENGVVVRLLACESDWCQIRADSHKGWLRRSEIWGVYTGETVE
ncbi:MAG: SH3 domain-containing protein [Pseudomonadota bacterium]